MAKITIITEYEVDDQTCEGCGLLSFGWDHKYLCDYNHLYHYPSLVITQDESGRPLRTPECLERFGE